jgi:undecaprenyl-diphosphatase
MMPPMHLDDQLFLGLNRAFSGGAATAFFCTVTWLGNGVVLAALIVPSMYIFARPKMKRHLVAMVLGVALGGLAVTCAKAAVDRPRPADRFAQEGIAVHTPLGVPPDRSFPSGHAQTAFGAALYLACLFPRRAWAFLSFAVLVGLSRIALGVHYPSDVIVGALSGSAFSLAAFLVARHMDRRTGVSG